jgi:hypothetical protein
LERAKKAATEAFASEQNDKPNAQGFRPSDYMRARRPALFSDSKIYRQPQLSRPVFEHLLKTITSRKQEVDFEYFCRRLSEKELCPRLLPQTGPTGGGDSKVDSETYPVSDEISMRWYEGLAANGRAQERWAFAFSAKEKWRSKVQDDVRKIAGTRRGYKLIYFITNQAVRDKVRAEVEDSLYKKYRIRVRILDRTWIMKCVFENDRMPIAIESFHLSGYERTQKISGPRDTKRRRFLDQLEKEIEDPERYRGVEYQLVEECLRAALLARGMELPRVEVEGRFSRAEKIALKLGHRQQQLRVAYARAWTAFWWFDDFEDLTELYAKVEEFAVGSDQSDDLGLLANIWSLLASCVRIHGVDPAVAEFDSRTATLRAELGRLAADRERVNNSLWARTKLLLVDLQSTVADQKDSSGLLAELKSVVLEAENLVSYPIETVANIVEELGDAFGSSLEYDDLFETIATIMRRRTSDGEAGRMLLARGHQKLRNGKKYDAIRYYGRAQQILAKREYRLELIAALVGGSLAYESVGLLWAARANVLSAANQALSEYYEHGEILPPVLTCLRKLAWVELQLGRVPHVLQWMELADLIAQHIAIVGKRKEAYVEERLTQDAILGILFLKADLAMLRSLEHLPDVLGQLGLDRSRMALLYALGYEDELRAEGYIPEGERAEQVLEFFEKWVTQPASSDLPTAPDPSSGAQIILRSSVLGCDLRALSVNNLPSISLAEHVLSALEALLATSLKGVFPHTQEFTVEVAPSADVKGAPKYQFEEGSFGQKVIIKHAEGEGAGTLDAETLQELTLGITVRIAFIDNLEKYGERVFGHESGFGRAINFTEPLVPLTNILGRTPKVSAADWKTPPSGRSFPLRRTNVWSDGLDLVATSEETARMYDDDTRGHGDPPKHLLDFEDHKHTQQRVSSLINIPLWDKAGWRGMVYAHGLDLSEPPIMALAFSDADIARSIFVGLRSRLGEVDKNEDLHISLVTGIDRKHPYSYAAVIGSNPAFPPEPLQNFVVMLSRIHRMDPSDSKNLDMFLRRFERIGRYFLMPAHAPASETQPKLLTDLWIGKGTLRVIPAWKIGRNDPDGAALRPGDDPVIPADVQNAPVLELLEWQKSKAGCATSRF